MSRGEADAAGEAARRADGPNGGVWGWRCGVSRIRNSFGLGKACLVSCLLTECNTVFKLEFDDKLGRI